MATLHMQTENVRSAASRLDQAVNELDRKPDEIKSAASSLKGAWQGGRSSYYATELRKLADTLQDELIDLERLARQLQKEVDEWEAAGAHLGKGGRLPGQFLFPIHSFENNDSGEKYWDTLKWWLAITTPGLMPSLVLTEWVYTNWEPISTWVNDHRRWSGFGGYEGSLSEVADGENPERVLYGKVGVGDTAIDGGYYKISDWEAGAKVGFGEKGFSAGVYGEYDLAEVEGVGVIGDSGFGFTTIGTVTAGAVDAFAGIKDNDFGASIGGSVAGAELGLGFNVAGYNIRLVGGIEAGLEAGFKIGDDTRVKAGPFQVGVSFGKALEPTFGKGTKR
jgi:uncharacterized protein YukE